MERTDMSEKKNKCGDLMCQEFGQKLFTHSACRVPEYSRLHPIIPQLYVQEWKTDMKNRTRILENAVMGGIPTFEHDENLFLEKREQMYYNVENPNRVESKYTIPDRAKLLRPDFHSELSRYQSELMFRRDSNTV